MHIDPHAWLLTLPLTLAIIRAGSLPADHWLRGVWRTLSDRETVAWCSFGLQNPAHSTAWAMITRTAIILTTAALAVASLLSFVAFLMQSIN